MVLCDKTGQQKFLTTTLALVMRMKKTTVLVLEVDSSLRRTLCDLLEEAGISAVAIPRMPAIFKWLDAASFAPWAFLVGPSITKLGLRRMHREIRQHEAWAQIPFIILTYHRDFDPELSDDGLLHYMCKWQNGSDIVRAVNQAGKPGT